MDSKDELDTFPKLLKWNFDYYGDKRIAQRRKDKGIWKEYTWKDYYEHTKCFSLGLISLGFKQGDRIAIIGDNDPEYYWAEIAAQSGCGSSVGIFTDAIGDEITYIVNHSDSTFIVAQDQEQVDKMLGVKFEISKVKKVIYWDPKGLWFYDDPWLISFEEVEKLGREFEINNPDVFEKNVAKGKGSDVGVLCYTSGTTGKPKGVMLNFNNLLKSTQSWLQVDPWEDGDEYLSFLPPAWGTEQFMGLGGALYTGLRVNFPETSDTIQEDLREISPQVVFYAARVWEDVTSTIQSRINDSSALKRFLFNKMLPLGYKAEAMRQNNENINLFWHLLEIVHYVLVLRPLHDNLGLKKIRIGYTAGAALGPDTFYFLRALKINIKQLYGTTETGINTIHRNNDVRNETVGQALPGSGVKISEDQEILLKGPSPFAGYYKDPKTTTEKLNADGWFHSGDAGYIDENKHLVWIERLKDLKELSDGHKFPPQYIEGKLKFSPYIKDAMAIGGKERGYVTTLIQIDFENVSRWAEENGISFTTFTDLSQKEQVRALMSQEVAKVNKTLPKQSRVLKYANLHKEFDPDEGELTRTRKLRKSFVEERFKKLINALYLDEEYVTIQSEVTYQSGKKAQIETSVAINRVQ